MQASALAGRVVRAINCLLHVAAGFLQDFAHLAGHIRGIDVFVSNQDFAQAEENFGAARRGRAPPVIERVSRRRDCAIDILFS